MSLLRPASIRQRLLLISAAITLLTLTVAGTLFVVNDAHMLRGQMALDGRAVGRIFIHARMDVLAAQLRRYAGMVGLLFLATLAVSLLLGVLHLVGRRIQRVNPRAAELFGWREEEMRGPGTQQFYPDREAFDEVGRVGDAQMAEGGVYRDERILRRKDGSRFWGRLIGQYIDPRDVELGSIWILDDIDRDKAL